MTTARVEGAPREEKTAVSNGGIIFGNQNEALLMFQFYENKGFADKQQMMTMVTWLTAFVFSLLGYCVVSIYGEKTFSGTSVSLAGWAALILSAYTVYIVYELLSHAENNYAKADNIIDGIKTLNCDTRNSLKSVPERNSILRKLRSCLGWSRVGRVFLFFLLWSIAICVLSAVNLYNIETR